MSDIVVHKNVRYRREDAERLGLVTKEQKPSATKSDGVPAKTQPKK